MAENLKALVQKKLQDRGLSELWPVIDRVVQLESSWNPNAHNTKGEDSVGLFQLNRAGGLGSGYSVTQLMTPETNIEIALSAIEGALKGGKSVEQALSPWTTSKTALQGGGTMTEPITAAGGVTMAKNQSFWDWLEEQGFISGPQSYVIEATGETVTLPGGGLKDGVTANMINDLWAQFSGSQGAGATPQETAVSQQGLDIALAKARAELKEKPLEWVAQKFANDIAALQEGRSTAEYAQEYASNIAPPSMTTMPYTGPTSAVGQLQQKIGMTPSPALPLPLAPASGPYEALGQAQQYVPQSPNLQFNAPSLPQSAPNLAGLSGFPQTMGGDMSGMGGGMGAGMGMGATAGVSPSTLPVDIRQLFSGSQIPTSGTAGMMGWGNSLLQAIQMLGLRGAMAGQVAQLPIGA